MEDDITIIKSLIAICKGGLPVSKIQHQYYEMAGNRLDFKKYGFKSLDEMLQSSPDIVMKQTSEGRVCLVNDVKMSHVTDLVNKTRSNANRKKSKNSKPFYTTHRASYNQAAYKNNASTQWNSFAKQRNVPIQNKYSVSRPSMQELSRRSPQRSMNSGVSQAVRPQMRSVIVGPTNQSNHGKQVQSLCVGKMNGYSGSHRKDVAMKSPVSGSSSFKRCVAPPETSKSQSRDSVEKPNFPRKVETSSSRVLPLRQSSVTSRPSSSSGWSSDDSDDLLSPPCQMNSATSRQVKIHSGIAVNGSATPSESISRVMTITVPTKGRGVCDNITSDSDWSDDDWSDDDDDWSEDDVSAARNDMRFVTPPRTSTISPLSRSDCSPSVLGSAGRGKLKAYMDAIKPSYKNSLFVSPSPAMRQAVSTTFGGQSTILVQIPNASSKDLQKRSPGPVYKGYQFVGDSILLRIAEVCLGAKVQRTDVNASCGLCKENMTITECKNLIKKRNLNSEKAVLMIGFTDIMQGATLDEMKQRMSSLIQTLNNKKIILLSLPILPSFKLSRKLVVLKGFNLWLLDHMKSPQIQDVIDVDYHLCGDRLYFERMQEKKTETLSEDGCYVVMDEIINLVGS